MKYSTKVVSNIYRSKDDPTSIRVGRKPMFSLKGARFMRGKFFDSKLIVTLGNDVEATIQQCDRGMYFVSCKHFDNEIQVSGWADGVRLLNGM